MRAGQIFDKLCTLAPLESQMDFDNCGFAVGDALQEVDTVLVALDMSMPVAEEAARLGAQLIVTHHPLLFMPLKELRLGAGAAGDIAVRLIKENIGAIGLHTNFDIAPGGVNDQLAQALGLENTTVLDETTGIGRIGELSAQQNIADFAHFVKKTLGAKFVRYAAGKGPVHRVAVAGGAGEDWFYMARQAGCDTFVTSEVSHHLFLEAAYFGLHLVDATHFATEDAGCDALCAFLVANCPGVRVVRSVVCRDITEVV